MGGEEDEFSLPLAPDVANPLPPPARPKQVTPMNNNDFRKVSATRALHPPPGVPPRSEVSTAARVGDVAS